MADIKFSEFPNANISKDSDEIAILQDGVNKMIASPILESKIINKTVSRVIDQGGASLNLINIIGVVPTYADLALITPEPELNDAYQVEADGLVYVYTETGFQAEGEGIVVQPEPIGVVEEGNTQAVSGGEVYKSFLKKGVADLESGSIATSTGELVNSNLRARTKDFLEGDSFVLTSDNLYVINILFYDQNDVFVQPLNVPDVREYSINYPIGATKYKLALARSNRTEVVTPTDINNSELLYVSNEKYDFDAIDTFKPMKSDYDNAELDFNTSENELGGISTSTGIPGAPNNIRIRSKDFIYVEESKGYSVENITPGFVIGRIFRYLDGVFVGFTPYPATTFTPDNTYNQVKFMFEKTNNTEVITPEELESFSFNIYSSVDDKITEIAERTSLIPKLEQRVTNLENQGEFNPWIGKKIVALGDSNTYGFIPYNDPGNPGQLDSFIKLSAEDLGMNFENFGISGSTLGQVPDEAENYRNPMVNRYDSMPDDADLILTMGGTNDLRFIRRLGVFDDRIKTTFKGALHLLYQGLMNKYVYDQLSSPKTIIAITPPKTYPDDPLGIEQLRIKDYRDAVIEVANYYCIPVFDLWALSGINPGEFRTLQGTATNYTDMYNPLSPDGVHFTQTGHQIIADKLIGFLKSLR